jgi:hypothetical protein
MKSPLCNLAFEQSIRDYHIKDDVEAASMNNYVPGTIEYLLYEKNRIDSIQWHLEDMIRDPAIDPIRALEIKRRIDRLNQERTDLVEYIDSWLAEKYKHIHPEPGAGFNTESPAWAIDRLSILALKIYHMKIETERADASKEHRHDCQRKLDILLQQQSDLSRAIDELIDDIAAGRKYMKVYRQMKMYNDASLNPVLYEHKK